MKMESRQARTTKGTDMNDQEHRDSIKKIEELVEEGMNIPALPAIGAELMSTLTQPSDEIDIRKLGRLLESDPSIAARLLRLANSPIYGCRTQTNSVAHAVTKLGLNETLEFLNYYFVRRTMPEFPSTPHFDNDYFWRHSWATANIARIIGNPRYLVRALPGELYLAGLLHGLGMALMAVHMPGEFDRAMVMHFEDGVSLAEAEHEVIGVNHASLSAHLLAQWRVPDRIAGAVRFHLEPVYAPNETVLESAGLVQMASVLAEAWCVGGGEDMELAGLEKSWIVERHRGPLADAAVQEGLKAEILKLLKMKKAMLLGDDEETAPAENETPAPGKNAPQSEPKPGFWARLKKILGF